MRNWPQTLSPASFKGVEFLVDEESLPKSGRFVAEHSYVRGETHETEDLGRVPREIRIKAYLASDTVDTDVQDFIELCSQAGAGALVLPLLGTYQARCRNCHVSGQKDRLGRMEIELDFVEAGTPDGTFSATPLGNRQAVSTASGIPTQVRQAPVWNQPTQ